jgi:hypothetical protein
MGKNKTHLYKYVSLDNYAIDIIKNGRLYLSDGSNFNDPFELSIIDKNTMLPIAISGLHILCLTNSYQNKLMWSHYAHEHKGICITVEIPKYNVYPICYSGKRVFADSDIDLLISESKRYVKKNLDKPYDNLAYEKKVAYIKDRKWEYEKEYRIVYDENDEKRLILDGDKWFVPVKIKKVYLGVNFDKNKSNDKENLLLECKKQDINVSQMKLDSETYALKIRKE